MSKGSAIRYSLSGDANEYKNLLRKFRLDALLLRINQESAAIMRNEGASDMYGVKKAQFLLTDGKSGRSQKRDVFVTAWGLVDLAYEAIMASNDYRGSEIESDEELYLLVEATRSHKEKIENAFIDNQPEKGGPDFLMHLWGFAGEQVKMQMPARALTNAARDLYILFTISKDPNTTKEIETIVIEETGTTWKNVLISLFLLWSASPYEDGIDRVEKRVRWDEDFELNEFRRVLNRYTITYKEVRDSKLGRQVLYTKPYVRTSSSGVISVNRFLNIFLYEHSILWIVRDYYKNQGDRYFTSKFGEYYEQYFIEVLDTYVEPEHYERLLEGKAKRADWRLQLGEHTFLIEQKSAVLGLAAKQQESDIDSIKTFATRNIVEALRQLENTEQELRAGKCIKIVLLYEDYLKVEILECIMPASGVADDGHYWLVTIDEMEKLLYQYKNNRQLYDSVIAEKIKRETEDSKDGRSIEQLLRERAVFDNQHLRQGKFQFYQEFAQNAARKRMRKNVVVNGSRQNPLP